MKKILLLTLITSGLLAGGFSCFDDNLNKLLNKEKSYISDSGYVFPNTPSEQFWTSTYRMSTDGLTKNIYYIDFGDKSIFNTINAINTSVNLYIRCSVNPSTFVTLYSRHETTYKIDESPEFTDNNDGTVTDTTTGIIWLKCPLLLNGQPDTTINCTGDHARYDSQLSANQACENLDYAGINIWKLPSVPELISIRDMSRNNPAIY